MSPRVDLPLVKKIELIKDSERCLSQRYLDNFESNQCNDAKRKIDDETYSWFVTERAKTLAISGPILQERARQIAAELGGKVVFKASNADCRSSRPEIVFVIVKSEAVNPITANEWINRFPSIIDGYGPSNIFNALEKRFQVNICSFHKRN